MAGRIALCLLVTGLLLPLICVNVTTAGWVSEELAEMVHGTVSAVAGLFILGILRLSDFGRFPPKDAPAPTTGTGSE